MPSSRCFGKCGSGPVIPVTQTLSAQAMALRKALLGAKEPEQLLFIDLPKAVGIENLTKASITEAVPAIAAAMCALDGCFESLLVEMQEAIGQALNTVGAGVRGDVSLRAARLKNQILDPKLRAFSLALADQELEADRDWLQRVGLSMLGRAPSEWIDADVQRFHVALNEMAPAFRRLEALHFNHQGDGQAGFKAVRVGITTSEGADHQQVISVPDAQAPALQSFVQRMLKEAGQTFGEAGGTACIGAMGTTNDWNELETVDELNERRKADGQKGEIRHG